MYQVTKTFGNELGLSCCFRQWRATHSHCSTLHGYSIGIKVVVEAPSLDNRNWVFDFGAFKSFKQWAQNMFDHTLLVAKDDPLLSQFKEMANIFNPNLPNAFDEGIEPFERGAVIDLRIVDAVGCEAFAKMAFDEFSKILTAHSLANGCYVKSVEVFEHGANSATYLGETKHE